MKSRKMITSIRLSFFAAAIALLNACSSSGEKPVQTVKDSTAKSSAGSQDKAGSPASGGDSVSNAREIPILCYHQIRDWTSKDSKSAKVYIIPVASFKEQMQILHDSGYHAVLPDQLIAHMLSGEKLPSKPIMLTFDDGPESQIENGLPELDKAGFKAVFFIMTVVLGHKNYFTKDQVKMLSQQGHVIGCHTWNHTMVTKYKTEADYQLQIVKPRAELEGIVGSPIKYFAYPFGIWNEDAAGYIKKTGFTAAFQLWGKKGQDKYFSIRRIIADPNWSGKQLLDNIRRFQQ